MTGSEMVVRSLAISLYKGSVGWRRSLFLYKLNQDLSRSNPKSCLLNYNEMVNSIRSNIGNGIG
jgi:hypothetical protein